MKERATAGGVTRAAGAARASGAAGAAAVPGARRFARTANGLLLGRYALGPAIGHGGMSTVYRGEDVQLGRPVAIKVLAPHLSADPQFRSRPMAEARAVARLPHRHVVQVYDVGSVGTDVLGAETPADTVVLVLELVEGESLAERLRRGPLPLAEAISIAAQVADALAFAHRRGIVHRDVKPGNVLLASVPPHAAGGEAAAWAKLADFGIARTLDPMTSPTATGVIFGSAPYVAPELLEGEGASERSDVYGLGVALFQMLTGRLPFEAETVSATLAARLAGEAPAVRSLRDDIPEWLDRLVAACLAREPHARLGDAGRLAAALGDPGVARAALAEVGNVRVGFHDATTHLLPRDARLPAAGPTRPVERGEPAGVRDLDADAGETPVAGPSRPVERGAAPHSRRRSRRMAVVVAACLAVSLVALGGLQARGRETDRAGAHAHQPVVGETIVPAVLPPPTPTAVLIRPR